MYSLEFYAPDGAHVKEGESDNLEELIDRWNNIGSRWFFYPIGVIFTQGGMVKLALDEYKHTEGRYRKYFEAEIEEDYGDE